MSDADEVEDLFKAEDEQYVCYDRYTIKVPTIAETEKVAVRVKSAKVI